MVRLGESARVAGISESDESNTTVAALRAVRYTGVASRGGASDELGSICGIMAVPRSHVHVRVTQVRQGVGNYGKVARCKIAAQTILVVITAVETSTSLHATLK